MLPLLAAFLKSPLESIGVFPEQTLRLPGRVQRREAPISWRLAGIFAVVGSGAALVGLAVASAHLGLGGRNRGAHLPHAHDLVLDERMDGLCTGAWGSLDYWIAQQDVQRGNQPWFYYHMLMPSYEFLPLAVAAAGVWWSVVRGDAFSRFLVFWIAGMWIALSAAGEKMPWLNTHIALPTALLAGWTISRVWNSWSPRPPGRDLATGLGGLALVSSVGFWFIVFDQGDSIPSGVATMIRVAAFAAIAVALAYAVNRFGRPAVPFLVMVVIVGALAFFSLQTMFRATYVRADTPDDLLIYTQSSPDLATVKRQINSLAEASGKGFELRIAVDSVNSFSWPWAWYLRDYTSVRYAQMTDGPPDGEWDVLLVALENAGVVNERLASTAPGRYAAPIRYPHRWWFDERYKSALPGTFRSGDTWDALRDGLTNGGWLTTWFKFWRDKEPQNAPGSTDAFAYFPSNFDLDSGVLGIRPLVVPEPGVDDGGRLFFGGLGGQQGQFFTPVDIDMDAQGNLYVIDSTTKRLSKFDGDGNVLSSTDVRTDPSVPEDSDPWGVTVLGDGRVAVADTFGWRVRFFSEDLLPLSSFGQPPAMDGNPGPFELFGPRDTAVDALGRLWVTDTGHHRLMVYGADGSFLFQVGDEQGDGQGQFSEPVGIDTSPDGEVFVADMYNARIHILDLDGAFLAAIPVDGWGGSDPADKPYLTVLSSGSIAVSLPLANEVRIYSRDGRLLNTITGDDDPLLRPYGMVQASDGELWIVESEGARVRKFNIQ